MNIGSFATNFRRLGIVVVIVLVLVLVMNFNARLGELTQQQSKAATVGVQATGIMNTQQALNTLRAYATSPAAVEDYARNQAHMGKEGDKAVVIIPDPHATPPPTPAPTPMIDSLTPLDVWLAFIFGK